MSEDSDHYPSKLGQQLMIRGDQSWSWQSCDIVDRILFKNINLCEYILRVISKILLVFWDPWKISWLLILLNKKMKFEIYKKNGKRKKSRFWEWLECVYLSERNFGFTGLKIDPRGLEASLWEVKSCSFWFLLRWTILPLCSSKTCWPNESLENEDLET
jgi:hypothetical protein